MEKRTAPTFCLVIMRLIVELCRFSPLMNAVLLALILIPGHATAAAGSPRIRILSDLSQSQVPRFGKFEVDFSVDSTAAENLQWPFDAEPPRGVPAGAGITVDAILTDPKGREYRQPCFLYEEFITDTRGGREWVYPSDRLVWKLRFAPNEVGTWRYRIVARDRSGTAESPTGSFQVIPGSSRGFIGVSASDRRYFAFQDGSLFTGLGFNLGSALVEPNVRLPRQFQRLSSNGVNFLRIWVSSLFGSAWNQYPGGRNRYGGYLPVTGLVPFRDRLAGSTALTLRIDYESTGDSGWFDACRLGWSDLPESVKPGTRYRIRVRYRGTGITGPRLLGRDYGFVVKLGGWFPNCHESGTSRPASGYGRNTDAWEYLEGSWYSRNASFLPRLYLALENATGGEVYVQEVSIREDLGGGKLGPEIMSQPSMEYQLYFPQKRAFALDRVIALAEQYGIYLKLVVMEKNDDIYLKLQDDGTFILNRDNPDGFYGTGRTVNKTRWLQQAWWRYLQARWGYSTSIHSWELTNEGDPNSRSHFELADEFGKYMHCRVFGVGVSAEKGVSCRPSHPNAHLVTTSFWGGFPAADFWSNPDFPNLDYADLHAYISTSPAPLAERTAMAEDSSYYHLWHSRYAIAAKTGKPVVRGEAGLDTPDRQDERALGVNRDLRGIWLHNFLWSGLDAGALYELYWWQSHIRNREYDVTSTYAPIGAFLAGIPLSKGGYVDLGEKVTSSRLRVVGQRNPREGTAHAWIQNRSHTWRQVAEGRVIEPVEGIVAIPGFSPGQQYHLEWWDTYTTSRSPSREEVVNAQPGGEVRFAVPALVSDIAVKIRPASPH